MATSSQVLILLFRHSYCAIHFLITHSFSFHIDFHENKFHNFIWKCQTKKIFSTEMSEEAKKNMVHWPSLTAAFAPSCYLALGNVRILQLDWQSSNRQLDGWLIHCSVRSVCLCKNRLQWFRNHIAEPLKRFFNNNRTLILYMVLYLSYAVNPHTHTLITFSIFIRCDKSFLAYPTRFQGEIVLFFVLPYRKHFDDFSLQLDKFQASITLAWIVQAKRACLSSSSHHIYRSCVHSVFSLVSLV